MEGPQIVFPIEFFQRFEPFTGHYRQHNACLKGIRHSLEHNPDFHNPADPFETPPFATPVGGNMKVPGIHHADVGMEFMVRDEWNVPWSWHEMVAQLDAASMEFVVNGPDGRSGGLLGCSFAVRPNSYDHKRSHEIFLRTGTAPDVRLPVWDFVLHREDGSGIRLHPQWSPENRPGMKKKKPRPEITTFDMDGHDEPVEVPGAGFGRSDGRGTYRWQLSLGNQKTLRFDTSGNKLPRR